PQGARGDADGDAPCKRRFVDATARRRRTGGAGSCPQTTARIGDRSPVSRPSDRQTALPMNPDRVVAGLDIGSAKTTAIIAEVDGDLPKRPTIRILGVGQTRTSGVNQGVVSDLEETTSSIKKAVEDAERMAGAKVEDLFCGIAGEHAQA